MVFRINFLNKNFSQIWSTDMAIDLGTANTLVFVKGTRNSS